MDPLDTMTAADWRRCYEASQQHVKTLLADGVAASRREKELVDRLRRRDEENQQLRDDLKAAVKFTFGTDMASHVEVTRSEQHRGGGAGEVE